MLSLCPLESNSAMMRQTKALSSLSWLPLRATHLTSAGFHAVKHTAATDELVPAASGSDGRRATGNGSRRRARRLHASTAVAAVLDAAVHGGDAEPAELETPPVTDAHAAAGQTEQVWCF